jgi:thiol-disulfide isomerase/thioredoxin
MKYLNLPVVYLQDQDFDNNGNLVNPELLKTKKPVMIMIQGNFCGYCTQAKPAFQKFAEENKGKVICATIQGDGKESGEKELSNRVSKIHPNFRGYPGYVLYKNGKLYKVHDGGRGVKDLEKFLQS